MKQCPSHSTLERFVEDSERLLESIPELAEHLDQCQRCQGILEDLARVQSRGFVGEILSGHLPDGLAVLGTAENSYRLEECLDSSTVYRAHRIVDRFPVAIKFLERLTPKQSKRVSLELQIASTVSHPHIVKMLDSGVQNGVQYAVFEWIGSNLSQKMVTGILPIRQAVEWVVQIASAVEHLHDLGFIHRDLKPQNVLVDVGGRAKLADFGIAKDVRGQDGILTTQSTPVGSPGYMAPEQTGLVELSVTQQTDVYGLGALLFSLLTGHPPFQGETRQKTIQLVAEGDLPAMRALRHDLPKALQTICEKCLSKDPPDRYSTAKAVVDDLKNFLDGKPIVAKAKPMSFHMVRWTRRHQRPLWFGGTSVIVGAALVGAFLWQASRERVIQRREKIDSTLLQLTNCEAGQISKLLVELRDFPPGACNKQLEVRFLQAPTDRHRIRLALVEPSEFFRRISPQQWAAYLRSASPREVAVLIEALSTVSSLPTAHRQELLNKIEQCDTSEQTIALCLGLIPDEVFSPSQELTSRLLNALQAIDSADADACRHGFHPWAADLTQAALGGTSDLASPLLHVLCKWNAANPSLLIPLIQRLSPYELSWIAELSTAEKELLRSEIQNELLTLEVERRNRLEVADEDRELAELVRSLSGVIFRDFGYVPIASSARLDQLLAIMNRGGWSLASMQTLQSQGEPEHCVALAIERSPGPCRIEWDVALDNLDTACTTYAEAWYLPKTFWLHRSQPSNRVDVVFTQSGIESAEFIGAMSRPFHDALRGDTDTLATHLEQQRYSHDALELQGELALITRRPIAERDESLRRVSASSDLLMVDGGTHRHETLHYVEQLQGGEAWVIVQTPTLNEQVTLAHEMALQGYRLRSIKLAHDRKQILSQWSRDSMASSSIAESNLILALWELGEDEPLLDALCASPDPGLRTEIVLALSKRSDYVRWMLNSLREKELNVDQIHQLIVALGKSNWQSWSPATLAEVKTKALEFESHPDSGVHSAANWLLRQIDLEIPPKVIDPSRFDSSIAVDKIPHRGWFYSRTGVPFVVVRTRQPSLIGSSPDIPWRLYLNQHIDKLDHDYAISAIEIPNALFGRFLAERPHPDDANFQIAPISPSNPVTAYPLTVHLRFCRWLSEQDGLDLSGNCLPSIADIKFGMQASDDFFERDGYRLPTQLEWEIAARAGTWSRAYFSDDPSVSSEFAWSSTNSLLRPNPIGLMPPNPWGLHDILGNVYEMNFFRYRFPFLGQGPLDEETEISLRGGSVLANQRYSSVDELNAIHAQSHDSNAGIRIVRTIPRVETKARNH